MRLKPDFALARKNLAKALVLSGQLRRGLAEYAEATRLAPDDGGVRNDYGRALVQAGRVEEAIARFAEAARLDPRSAATQINWGLALEQSGRPAESIAHFAEAVRLEPDRVDNHLLLATALARRGKVARSRLRARNGPSARPRQPRGDREPPRPSDEDPALILFDRGVLDAEDRPALGGRQLPLQAFPTGHQAPSEWPDSTSAAASTYQASPSLGSSRSA